MLKSAMFEKQKQVKHEKGKELLAKNQEGKEHGETTCKIIQTNAIISRLIYKKKNNLEPEVTTPSENKGH